MNDPASGSVATPKKAAKKKIGEMLIEAGLITPANRAEALVVQQGRNKRFGKVLIEMGLVTEEHIARVLAEQLSHPLVDIGGLDIPQEVLAIVPKDVAEKSLILPLKREGRRLSIAMADPLDWETIDSLRFRTGYQIHVSVCTESSIVGAIERFYGTKEQVWDLLQTMPEYEGAEIVKVFMREDEVNVSPDAISRLSEAAPIIKLVTMILVDAVRSRASDIHIEPREKYVQVRYRIDGNLKNVFRYPAYLTEMVISRIKIISNLDITNRRFPQDGRSMLRYEDRDIDLRVSSLPSVFGENIVIRLLDQTAGRITLSDLGIPAHILLPLLKLASQPQGMILVTGPTGSGKTTTLYALLLQLLTETQSVFSVEDPVEYKISGMTQVHVNDAIGFTFAAALRSILRQDPDIIMVGEIRDPDTANIAIRASLTGHLVLSTVHTNDTVSTIMRLVEMGIDRFLISSSLSGILAQRLVRRICPKCRDEGERHESLAGVNLPPLEVSYRGKGCDYCDYSGYRGRVGVYEFLFMDKKLRRLLARNASEEEVWEAVREAGTRSLFENAWEMVREGVTTVEEVLMKVPHKSVTADLGVLDDACSIRVLLYDIPPSDALLIKAALEPEGYEILTVTDADIVETANRECPNCIILESLDKMLQPVRQLGTHLRHQYMPVLVLTDDSGKGYEDKAAETGVKGFISRPLDGEKLKTELRRLI